MAHSAIAQHAAALAGIPAQPTARPVVQPGYRLVPVPVGRQGDVQTVYVPCPVWCVTDHSEPVLFAEDINHAGEHSVMSLSPSRGDRVPVEVYLSQWPGSEEEKGQTYLAVDLDYEVSTYGRTAALAMADQLVAFAADVRRLAETLPDDQPVRRHPRQARGGRS